MVLGLFGTSIDCVYNKILLERLASLRAWGFLSLDVIYDLYNRIVYLQTVLLVTCAVRVQA